MTRRSGSNVLLKCWIILVLVAATIGMQTQPVSIRRGARHLYGPGTKSSTTRISSPNELQEFAQRSGRRVPGSKNHEAAWSNWSLQSVDAVSYHLKQNLPVPADPDAFEKLFFNLGTAVEEGKMPSFACPKARAGYAIAFMCRAKLIADIFLDKYNQPSPNNVFALQHNQDNDSNTKTTCRILSLGGGPGYDYLGVLLAATFGTAGRGEAKIEGMVFDYEEGWQDLVEAMNTATQLAFANDNGSFMKWGGRCDITKPLSDPCNLACQAAVGFSDVIICQYCVAENAKRLRDSDFSFFEDLFEQAADSTTFVITETTPRIWPEIVDVLLQRPDQGNGFSIDFLRTAKRSVGVQLVIHKRRGNTISQEELAACKEFRMFQELHEKKIQSGYKRQPKKVRGTKGMLAGWYC